MIYFARMTGAGLLQRLSRISSSGRFIPEIDGLRFVAITAVVLHHLACFVETKTGMIPMGDRLYIVVNQGFFGVQLFFVISGFILALPFAESRLQGASRVPLARYFGRRLTRLEPPYAINLFILFAWLILRNGRSFSELWRSLLASLFYVHAPVFSHGSYINPVAWSLEIEVQFYILAPLLCLAFELRKSAVRRTVLVAAMMVSSIANEIWTGKPIFISRALPGHVHYFLLGLLLADWYLVEGARGLRRNYGWDLLGLVSWCGIGVGLMKVGIPRSLLLPLILMAYMAAFRGRILNAILCLPLLTTIGGMCYTIYLYHNFLIQEIGGWTWTLTRPDHPFWRIYLLQGTLILLPVLLICALLFAWVERPCMRPRWWKRQHPAPGTRQRSPAAPQGG